MSACILNAFNQGNLYVNGETFQWINDLNDNLPPLVFCEDIVLSKCDDGYNNKWKKLLEKLSEKSIETEIEICYAQKFRPTIDVHIHKQFSYFSFQVQEERGKTPLIATLDLQTAQIQAPIQQRSSSIVHVSILSGILITGLNPDIVCMVKTVYEESNCTYPPCIQLIDSNNTGPLYLNFYLNKEEALFSRKVLFEFNFFKLHKEYSYFDILHEGRVEFNNDQNIIKLKKYPEITEPRMTLIEDDFAMSHRVSLTPELSIGLKQNDYSTEQLVVLFFPSQKFSLGKSVQYSPAIVRLSHAFGGTLIGLEWLPIKSLRETTETDSGCSTCILGDCVNNDILVAIHAAESNHICYLTSSTPGLNGFIKYFLPDEVYEQLSTFCTRWFKMCSCMQQIDSTVIHLQQRFQDMGEKRNKKLIQLRFQKALLYAYAFSKCEVFSVELKDISDEAVKLLGNRNSLIDAEEMVEEFCMKYNDVDEGFVLLQIDKARILRTKRSKSFMQVIVANFSLLGKNFIAHFPFRTTPSSLSSSSNLELPRQET